MGGLKTFLSHLRPAPLPISASQVGVQERAFHHLIARGQIDAWTITQLGTTDCHKMPTRLRRKGLLYPLNDPRSFYEQQNAKGGAKHRVHRWSGQLPPEWVKTDGYTGRERRKKPRGCN